MERSDPATCDPFMKIEYPVEKIQSFAQNCLSETPVGISSDKEIVVYRAYYRLLAVNHLTAINVPGRKYLTECISDCSGAYFLFFININKQSMTSLRSSIENGFRYFLKSNGIDPDCIDNIPELIRKCRSINIYGGKSILILNGCYNLYRELCRAVHSSHDDYLSKEIPFQNLTKLDKKASKKNLDLLLKSFQNLLKLIVISNYKAVRKQHSVHFDSILDGLSKELKRALHD